jgi:predicted small secreted protein
MRRLGGVLVLSALALAGCVNGMGYGRDAVHEHVQRTLQAAGIRSVVVENVSGPITIAAVRGNAATIGATKSANDTDAMHRTHIDITRDGDEITVHTRYDEGGGWFSRHNGASVSYDIRVPARMDIDVNNVSGSVQVRGIAGDLAIREVSGRVEAAVGRVVGSRHVRISSVSGAIDVSMAKNSDVRVDGKTVSGGIQTFFPADVRKGFVGQSLNGRVGAGSASMSLEAVSGSITLSGT